MGIANHSLHLNHSGHLRLSLLEELGACISHTLWVCDLASEPAYYSMCLVFLLLRLVYLDGDWSTDATCPSGVWNVKWRDFVPCCLPYWLSFWLSFISSLRLFLAQQKAAHICDRNRLYKSHSKNIVVSVIVWEVNGSGSFHTLELSVLSCFVCKGLVKEEVTKIWCILLFFPSPLPDKRWQFCINGKRGVLAELFSRATGAPSE